MLEVIARRDFGEDFQEYMNFSGYTPLHFAVLKSHEEIIKILISNGNINLIRCK